MMVLWQSLGINTYHQWFTIDHQCIAVIVNSKVIRLLAKIQWIFETEHLMSTLINKTQPKSSQNGSIRKKRAGSQISNLGRWYSSQPNPTQWKPDNNASNFPFALISLLSPGRELLILTTQKSASLTKFFVYPPNLNSAQTVLPPQPNLYWPTNQPKQPQDRSVNWFKKSEQTWKTMK